MLVTPAIAAFLNALDFSLASVTFFFQFGIKDKLQWENRQTLNQLRQKLAQVLETITPDVIASLTSYNFILEALFSAAS